MGRATIRRFDGQQRGTPRGRAQTPASSAPEKLDRKLAAFVRKHWPERGRAARIARAEKAWPEAMEIASTFKEVDAAELKRIAEDPDLEYM